MSETQIPNQVAAYNPQNALTKWAGLSLQKRIDLDQHERLQGTTSGGHTLERHVGLTVSQLLARFPGVPKSSTFMDKKIAEIAATEWFDNYSAEFDAWYKDPQRTEVRFSKELILNEVLGIYICKNDPQNKQVSSKKFNLVMKVAPHNNMDHHILTAFPIPE